MNKPNLKTMSELSSNEQSQESVKNAENNPNYSVEYDEVTKEFRVRNFSGRQVHSAKTRENAEAYIRDITEMKKGNEVTVEQIEDTPYTVLTHYDEYYLSIGRYRMEKPFDDKEEAIKFARTLSWQSIAFLLQVRDCELYDIISKTLKNN